MNFDKKVEFLNKFFHEYSLINNPQIQEFLRVNNLGFPFVIGHTNDFITLKQDGVEIIEESYEAFCEFAKVNKRKDYENYAVFMQDAFNSKPDWLIAVNTFPEEYFSPPAGIERVKAKKLVARHYADIYAGGAAAYAFEFGSESWFEFYFGFDCTFSLEVLIDEKRKEEIIGFIIGPESWTGAKLRVGQEIPRGLIKGLDRTFSLESIIKIDEDSELENQPVSIKVKKNLNFTTGTIDEPADFDSYEIDDVIEISGELIAFNFNIDPDDLKNDDLEQELLSFNQYPFMVIKKEFFE